VPNFAKTLIADTGFWFALYDPRDQYHTEAQVRDYLLESANILVPWPSLYEVFNSRFAKNRLALRTFDMLLRQPHVSLIADEGYREAALEACFKMGLIGTRCIALVDMVIRLILEDTDIRKHGLLTFNLRDFSDLCWKYRIEIL